MQQTALRRNFDNCCRRFVPNSPKVIIQPFKKKFEAKRIKVNIFKQQMQ